jgi:hypothetical protein
LKKIENPDKKITLDSETINIINKLTPILEQRSVLFKNFLNLQKQVNPSFYFNPKEKTASIIASTFTESAKLSPSKIFKEHPSEEITTTDFDAWTKQVKRLPKTRAQIKLHEQEALIASKAQKAAESIASRPADRRKQVARKRHHDD